MLSHEPSLFTKLISLSLGPASFTRGHLVPDLSWTLTCYFKLSWILIGPWMLENKIHGLETRALASGQRDWTSFNSRSGHVHHLTSLHLCHIVLQPLCVVTQQALTSCGHHGWLTARVWHHGCPFTCTTACQRPFSCSEGTMSRDDPFGHFSRGQPLPGAGSREMRALYGDKKVVAGLCWRPLVIHHSLCGLFIFHNAPHSPAVTQRHFDPLHGHYGLSSSLFILQKEASSLQCYCWRRICPVPFNLAWQRRVVASLCTSGGCSWLGRWFDHCRAASYASARHWSS